MVRALLTSWHHLALSLRMRVLHDLLQNLAEPKCQALLGN
ncbi:hypothetical protein ART_2274 [Arthrobacter sp. PAMC 25486]|nr:hypothetical protein ART_2274 [Arthrobacter sp. PAMC 25486]